MVIGDAAGHVYIYTLSQLLSHAKLDKRVSAMAVHVDAGMFGYGPTWV
jgi:ammonia channel protein AmtB